MTDIHILPDSTDEGFTSLDESGPDNDAGNNLGVSKIVVQGSATIVIDDDGVKIESSDTIRVLPDKRGPHQTGTGDNTVVCLNVGADSESTERDHETPWRVDGFVG